jgi:peptidoglycan/LPS O-acetylase OafA/YrhL
LDSVQFTEKFSAFSAPVAANSREKIRISLGNMPVKRVRLDTGETTGRVKIFKMEVHSRFAESVTLFPADIQRLFASHSPGTLVRLGSDYLEVISTTDDPYLISETPLLRAGFLLGYGLPLLAATLFFLVLQQADFPRFPAFADINDRQPTSGENITALDGLRGVAVIMVVADHTWGCFTGIGAEGVWIFMALSGFLLARPFVLEPQRARSLPCWRHFFVRRARRIVPVYYFYIIIIYLLSLRFDEAVRHFLFLQGSGHLWVVPQEMIFYLLTPFIMAVNWFVFRGRPVCIVAFLFLLMGLANHYFDVDALALYGMNYQKIRLYVGIFIAGFITSYLYYGLFQHYRQQLQSKNTDRFFFGLTVLLLLFFFLGSTARMWGGHQVYAQIYFQWFGFAAAVLIFSILAGRATMANRFLSLLPLRAISVVSFSLYLFHPLVLECIRKGIAHYTQVRISSFFLFVTTLCLSYVVACFTYTYIERPFVRTSSPRG